MKIISTIVTLMTIIFSTGFMLCVFLRKEGGESGFALWMFGGVCILGIFISGILGSFISIALVNKKNKLGYLYLIINALPAIILFLSL